MDAKTILNNVKIALGIEVKLEQVKLDNGTVIEADQFVGGAEVFIVNGVDKVPLPVGDYTLEDGRILHVQQDGIIAEIDEAGAVGENNEGDMPMPANAPADVPVAAETQTSPKKIVESVSKEQFFSEMEKLKNEFDAKIQEAIKANVITAEEIQNAPVVDLTLEDVELAEEVKPIKHSPEAQVTKKEQMLYSQKRPMTTRDRVFQKLFN